VHILTALYYPSLRYHYIEYFLLDPFFADISDYNISGLRIKSMTFLSVVMDATEVPEPASLIPNRM
jgi:hypothetical protein